MDAATRELVRQRAQLRRELVAGKPGANVFRAQYPAGDDVDVGAGFKKVASPLFVSEPTATFHVGQTVHRKT